MRKMLCYAPVLFALACGGGRIDSPPVLDCTQVTPANSTFTVGRGSSLSVSYTSNCNSVVATSNHPDVFHSQTLPANGTFTVNSATVSMTITLTGKGNTPSNTTTAQVAVNVQQPAPSLHIASAPDSVVLNHSIKLSLDTQNILSCSYSTNWKKTGKEDEPATTAPWFLSLTSACSPVFNPGSTMPDPSLGRKVQLKVCGTGYDGVAVACDSVSVRLVDMKTVIDTVYPTTIISGVPTVINVYSRDSTFTTSNGVDYPGTLWYEANLGDPVPTLAQMVPALGSPFADPTLRRIATTAVLGTNEVDHYYVDYFATADRPCPPASFTTHVIRK